MSKSRAGENQNKLFLFIGSTRGRRGGRKEGGREGRVGEGSNYFEIRFDRFVANKPYMGADAN